MQLTKPCHMDVGDGLRGFLDITKVSQFCLDVLCCHERDTDPTLRGIFAIVQRWSMEVLASAIFETDMLACSGISYVGFGDPCQPKAGPCNMPISKEFDEHLTDLPCSCIMHEWGIAVLAYLGVPLRLLGPSPPVQVV